LPSTVERDSFYYERPTDNSFFLYDRPPADSLITLLSFSAKSLA
jgi:hypothetical protein